MNGANPKWILKFVNKIEKYWHYHAFCTKIAYDIHFNSEINSWQINASPVFQEIYGGEKDGKKVWSGFSFDVLGFAQENGIWCLDTMLFSKCAGCSDEPKIMMTVKFQKHKILLTILLRPPEDMKIFEVVDVANNKSHYRPSEDENDVS